ncbi:hypothetical protein LJB42_004730 [Komagataella kurtzmanii]|nr:hypothetical protein LJB42_004730 [Komagataella kurtzmanii]
MSQSVAPECTELKNKYDSCFNSWYTDKFLQGKSLQNECEGLWDDYRECLEAYLIKKGIKPMVDETAKDAPFEEKGELQSKEKK